MQSLNRTTPLQPIGRLWVNEALFWLHFAIILGGVSMGLLLPWYIALSIIIIHRLHLRLFGGCAFSVLQRRAGLLGEEDFLQQLSLRLFNVKLKKKYVPWVDRSIIASSMMVILLVNIGYATIVFSFLIVSLAVFGMLFAKRMLTEPASKVCSVNQPGHCATVKSSRFSKIWGISVEYLGIAFFGVLILFEIILITTVPSEHLLFLYGSLLLAGSLTALFFIVVQSRVLSTICRACMNIHGTTGSLMLLQIARVIS